LSIPFDNLDKEKQERILNAAMKEFASKGYDNASTNEIVKEANIGKGRLFHYFNTKKDLFLFLFDYSFQIIKSDYYDLIDVSERDIFTRLHQVTILNIEAYRKHPWMFDFAKVAMFSTSEQVKEELAERRKDFTSIGYSKLYMDIDTSLFKEGIDFKKAMELITWSIEGYGNRIIDKLKCSEIKDFDFDQILEEFDTYLEILRKCFYK
jgi:TetR/AcrR family transcriptional regulator